MALQYRSLTHLERLIEELAVVQLSSSTPSPRMTKTRAYTLTGFTDSLERRRLIFLEPLPDSRVCATCGVVPFQASLLPCGHAFCRFCEEQIRDRETCPVDQYKYDEENVQQVNFPLEDLEQHRVLCGVAGEKCEFVGTVSDMECHLASASPTKANAPGAVNQSLAVDAVDHYRHCTADLTATSLGQAATCFVPSSVFQKLSAIKEDVEYLRQHLTLSEDWEEGSSDGADVTSSLIDSVVGLVRELLPVGKVTTDQDRVFAPSDSAKLLWTFGPYRGASKAGVFLATCAIETVNARWDSDDNGNDVNVTSEQCTAAGYTFRIRAHFVKYTKQGVRVDFAFFLESGEWDDHIAWPFAKQFSLKLTHPVDASRDVALPAIAADEDSARKPIPGVPNEGYKTDTIEWSRILRHGYIAKNKIYVTVELE
ncbi:hypothetical protein HPB51_011894 [Rhipicephalus microplus]|uniref:RING-type domain-containing protein n=1 Tax=Rhipicephalus microplus TaxID=6941 RepID=A0A9J6E943_RHIMP|nr:hypothetical protein HPB51_011894 [Rhipicephalus microplus]